MKKEWLRSYAIAAPDAPLAARVWE